MLDLLLLPTPSFPLSTPLPRHRQEDYSSRALYTRGYQAWYNAMVTKSSNPVVVVGDCRKGEGKEPVCEQRSG
jgi:hypothetical protein